VTIELGAAVRWIPTGDVGVVHGLTVEPSAIVVFPHGRQTIGLSKLEELPESDPAKPASEDYVRGVRDALDVIATGLHEHGNVDPEDIHQARVRFYGGGS
jgi:hypothetical protein